MLAAAPGRNARWRSPLAMLLAGLLALGVFLGSEWTHQRSVEAFTHLAKRDSARSAVQTILRRVLDMETAQRGYLLTSRTQYLKPYQEAASEIANAFRQLREPGGIDADLLGLVDTLEERVRQKTSEVDATIALFDTGANTAWRELLLTDIGREKMEAVRETARALLDTEDRRIEVERAAVARTLAAGRYGVQALTLLSLLAYIFFLRKNAALVSAQLEHAVHLKAERDSLEDQVRRRTVELATLNRDLQVSRDDERGGLARALHDDLGALLTAAKLDIIRLRRALHTTEPEVAARLEHLSASLDEGIVMKRRMMEELMPPALPNLGLKSALEHLASDFQGDTGVPVELALLPLSLHEADEQALFAVARGALSNAQRHADATQVSLRLATEGTQVRLEVQDNGRGFAGPSGTSSAHGLKNLRYRIESLGGEFLVQSVAGTGTHVRASLPMRPREPLAPSPLRATTPP